ncbi:vanadium-dependent haloperoxidase [Candidatus Peregrinibacteria bacterium]|nr:vanadium-dependent haloperoxidase [Candidatus Peregrinibacteria bacterium]
MSEDTTGNFGAGLHNNPGAAPRTQAIVHAAIFDALNSITRTHEPYRTLVPVQQNSANIDAAVATAGYLTMKAMYPNQSEMIDEEYAVHIAEIADGPEKDLGIIVGNIVAQNIIAERTNDGSEIVGDYTPSDQPGFHRKDPINPEQPFWGPVWGAVTPFVLENGSQFRAPEPPALDSEEYANAYNEVKSLGGDSVNTPTDRTEEQTEIGLFWAYDGGRKMGVPPRLYNKIAHQIAIEQGNTMEDNARLFALMNLAQADAGIAAWESKYYYNYWRPVIGIRESDQGTGPSGIGDGNDATEGDTEWTPLGAPSTNNTVPDFTPPFPAYPSGHATFGASTMHLQSLFYGNDNIPFTFTSDELNGVTLDNDGSTRPLSPRSFESFTEAMEENGRSRIYLGIHWQFDADAGIEIGTNIAEYTFANFLRPTEELSPCIPEGEEGEGVPCIDAEDYDLTGTMTAPISVQRGSSFAASLNILNAGPGNAEDASIAVTLPAGITLNAVNSGTCSATGSTLVCNEMDVASGSTVRAEIELSVSEEHACPSEITFTPVVTSSDSNDYYGPNNNGDTVTVAVDCEPENDLSATLTGPSSVDEGSSMILNLRIANAGPSGAATAYGEIPLVAGVSFDADRSGSQCVQNGSVIRCTTQGIAPQGSVNYAVAFNKLSLVSCGTDFSYQATVHSGEHELNESDNTSSVVTVTVNCVENSQGGAGQTIEDIREEIREREHSASEPGSSRGSGTNEALTTLALLCHRNGMATAGAFTGSYRVRGNTDRTKTLVAADEELIIDGFTESERAILCGMKKFMNQEDMPKRQTPEYREWLIARIAETLHKTAEEVADALASETLCK